MTNYQNTRSTDYLNIGVASGDVTPSVGCANCCWGAASHEVNAGIHKPLIVTMWYIDGENPMLLVGMDGSWWQDNGFERLCRQTIADALAIAPEQILMCLSHTHAGVPLTRNVNDGPGADLLRGYNESLPNTLAEIAQQAKADLQNGILQSAYTFCNLASQRDECRDGDWVVGSVPDEDAESCVVAARLCDASGKLRGVLVNYACHPTTLAWENTLISPDYIGAMREQLEAAYGVPVLFLLGACGDLAPRRQYTGDLAIADANGRQLAFAVQSCFESLPSPGTELEPTRVVLSGADLGCWEEQDIPAEDTADCVVEATPGVFAWREDFPSVESLERDLKTAEGAIAERLRRRLRIHRSLNVGNNVDFTMWSARIGKVLFLGTPAEPYSSLQSLLRETFSEHIVLVVNHCNGGSGYLMPRNCYEREDFYAATQTPFAAGSFEQLQALAVVSLNRLSSSKGNKTCQAH